MTYKEDICEILRELDIVEGDIVLLHSSLSSVGRVDGGAAAVIDAFIEMVGTAGTLVMPAFPDDISRPFDAFATASDTGIITEVFRKKEGVIRSLHPTHSVCAYGKFAGEITENHQNTQSPCGKGTPFHKICDLKGKIVLLGVDMNRNTLLHTAEDIAEMEYLPESYDIPAPTYINGERYPGRTYSIKKLPLGHRDFLKLTPLLRERGLVKEAFIGMAAVKVMDAEKLLGTSLGILQSDPDYFLCNNYYCNSCMTARTKIISGYKALIFKENRCKLEFCEVCSVQEEL